MRDYAVYRLRRILRTWFPRSFRRMVNTAPVGKLDSFDLTSEVYEVEPLMLDAVLDKYYQLLNEGHFNGGVQSEQYLKRLDHSLQRLHEYFAYRRGATSKTLQPRQNKLVLLKMAAIILYELEVLETQILIQKHGA